MPSIPLKELDIVAFADPSGGKSAVKRVQARSAIVVLGQDEWERVALLKAWAQRTSTDRFIEEIFSTAEQWRPRQFGIEANALQTLFADALRREARFNAQRIVFVDVWQSTRTEKPFRNRAALQPVINNGRFLIADDMVEAWNELATHPMCPQFDIVDAIAGAVGLLRKRPKRALADEEGTKLAAHLRRTGHSETEIRAALARRQLDIEVPPRPESH